jgi:hypothetical protein
LSFPWSAAYPAPQTYANHARRDVPPKSFVPETGNGNVVADFLFALQLVIDRKRIFLFRPKTDIRQENATEYSADTKYSAQNSKHRKSVKLYKEKYGFLGWHL